MIKELIKRWFKNEDFKEFFGRGYTKLFNQWKKDNKKYVEEFQNSFKKIIEK